MKIKRLSPEDYAASFGSALTVFSTAGFSQLNAHKVEEVAYLAFDDDSGRRRLGLIAGRREDGSWRCPFSAPFGELTPAAKASLDKGVEMTDALKGWLGGASMMFTLPPEFMLPANYGNLAGPLLNASRKITYNYNYHYDLSLYPRFAENLERNARKNFNRAAGAGFVFGPCDIARAYEVIRINRSRRGYYLAMTLEQVKATASEVDIDCFVLSLGGADVAAAIVYTVAPGIAHVVYWGDVDGFGELRPMNILPYHLFGHYASLGYRVVNIGPSSIDGVPSLGLCAFKQSLGCALTLLPTFVI